MAAKKEKVEGNVARRSNTNSYKFMVGRNNTGFFGQLQNIEGNQASLQYDFGKLKQHFVLMSGNMKTLSSKTIPVWAYTEKNGFLLFRVHVCQIG